MRENDRKNSKRKPPISEAPLSFIFFMKYIKFNTKSWLLLLLSRTNKHGRKQVTVRILPNANDFQ